MSCSDHQWAKIKALLLARIRVDADTVTVGKRSLRDELDRLSVKYTTANRKPLTMRQLRNIVGAAIDKIDALRGDFFIQEQETGKKKKKEIATIATMYAGDEEAAELRDLLDKIKAKLQSVKSFDEARDAPEIVQCGQELMMQWPKLGNARKLQNEYWISLAKLWRQLVPQTTSKDVVTFIEIITNAKPAAIRSYLYRSGAT